VVADAVSYLLSALGIRATGGQEPRPERREAARMKAGDLLDGWRYILADTTLRPLLFNTALFNGLVMTAEPLLAVLMFGRLGFAPWQYGLAFAAPSIGGCSVRGWPDRSSPGSGSTRSWSWPGRYARCGPSAWLLLEMGVEVGLIFCCGVFNPVYATYRLERTATDRVGRTLSAWAVTTKASTALLTAVWGVLGRRGPRQP
jgi:hypothetical protein